SADDELGRHDAVPAVLRQAKRDVVAGVAPKAIELGAEAEGDRLARVAAAVPDPKAKVLAVSDRRRLRDLAAVDEKRDARVAETERGQPAELGAEVEIQLEAGHDRIDARHRPEVVL